jgi:hypothetical protein
MYFHQRMSMKLVVLWDPTIKKSIKRVTLVPFTMASPRSAGGAGYHGKMLVVEPGFEHKGTRRIIITPEI